MPASVRHLERGLQPLEHRKVPSGPAYEWRGILGATPSWWVLHLLPMPTKRKRHVITETDKVAAALDVAERRWPDEPSRSRLLVRVIEEGRLAMEGERERDLTQRREAVMRTSGVLTGVYGVDYLTELREDWPE